MTLKMKLHYYSDTDSLYIEFILRPGAETREVTEGLNMDLDASGGLVGIGIDKASHFDLSRLETVDLSLRATEAA